MSIGVVGVGNMGLAMALRLRDAGMAVAVRDIDGAREALAAQGGCTVAVDAAALAAGCELLIVAVVDAGQCDEVLLGAGGAATTLRPGQTVMLCPTIAPADTERLAAALAVRGVDVIDAPMSGGPLRARQGTMSLMLAADAALLQRWQAVLAQLSDRQFRVSERVGDGARTKLVNNLLAAANLAAAAEALALAQQVGLDAATTLGVIEQSSGQSWIGSDRLHRALACDAAAQAHLALLAKDTALALDLARAAGAAVPVGAAAAACFAGAMAAGHARDDDSVLLRWLQAQRSGNLSVNKVPGLAPAPAPPPRAG
ncbi:MAG: NAD(P)-binding domain-containing protein [Rubrivivax sp.]|nr:NAD(P)-binding domain-containing protein [Rubrivivax sp.]